MRELVKVLPLGLLLPLVIGAAIPFMVWTVPAIKERRANPQSEKLKTHLLTMFFYFLCAALVVGIWRFVPPPPTAARIPTLPATASPPPLPPEPWVSEAEFQEV